MKKSIIAIVSILFLLWIIGSCMEDDKKPATQPMPAQSQAQKTEQKEEPVKPSAKNNEEALVAFIKGSITAATEVKLTSQIDNDKTYLADININKDPFTGGKNDWNMVAGEVSTYCKILLNNPSIVRLHFAFYSPENKNIDWAHVRVDRNKLPAKWENDSYLHFFSYIKPDPGTLQATQWLCDFYKKYGSARPNGQIPDFCSMYNK